MRSVWQQHRLLLAIALIVADIYLIFCAFLAFKGLVFFGRDFDVFYRGLSVWQHWPPASPYHTAEDARYFAGETDSYRPFLNPPYFLFLLAPLSLFSQKLAFGIFVLLQLILWWYVLHHAAVKAFWPKLSALPAKQYSLTAIALSLTFIITTAAVGQLGIALGAFMLLGAALLPSRPVLAGLLLALVSIKPQYALLILLFLAAGRHGKALLSCCLALFVFVLCATLVWGTSIWDGYRQALMLHSHMLQLPQMLDAYSNQMVSIYNGLRLLHVPVTTALAGQLVASLAAAAFVIWAAMRRPLVKAAMMLFVSTFIASAYMVTYDQPILVAPLLALLNYAYERNHMPWWLMPLMIAFIVSPILVPYIQYCNIPYGCAILLLLWVAIGRRAYDN